MADVSMPPSRQPIVDRGSAPASVWWVRWLQEVVDRVNSVVQYGSGSPEGAVTANPGAIWMDVDGGAGAVMYVKETGTGNTGWAVK